MIYDYFLSTGLKVYNLHSYIKQKTALTLSQLQQQYTEQQHYYFVAVT